MISKSNSTNSLISLCPSPRNKIQTSSKEQITASDSDLKPIETSLFQTNCEANEPPSPKTMLEYAEEIFARIPDTKKETEIEAIKNELIKIIDLQTFIESDFEDFTSGNIVVLTVKFLKKLIKEYMKCHKLDNNNIDSNKKQKLKDELSLYVEDKLIPLTNSHKKFVKEHPWLFKPISIEELCKRIF